MANICSNEINIMFENLDDAKTAYDKLMEWRQTDTDVLTTNIGYILNKSNIWNNNDETPPYTRGDIISIELDGEKLTLFVDSAWTPVVRVFDVMLRKTFPDMKFDTLYRSEEPGCDIYYTNDSSYEWTYIVDCCSDKINDVFYVNKQSEVEDILRDVLPKYANYKKMEYPELVSEAQNKNLAYVHQYQPMDINELS